MGVRINPDCSRTFTILELASERRRRQGSAVRFGEGESVDEKLTVEEVLRELQVPRSTFFRWRQLAIGPRAIKLPNGQLRFRRSALEAWLRQREEGGERAA
jgi:predicted DNA-binding transcriptional regulator AlpA